MPSIRLAQSGRKVVEVPIVFRERTTGESKMSGSIVAEAVAGIPALRFGSRPR